MTCLQIKEDLCVPHGETLKELNCYCAHLLEKVKLQADVLLGNKVEKCRGGKLQDYVKAGNSRNDSKSRVLSGDS